MPRTKTLKNRKLSKKKMKQKQKRDKLSTQFNNPPPSLLSEEEYINLRKYYMALALLNVSQLLYEQGDLTWGGIVDPLTYEVTADHWPNTDIKINDYDKSRINSISTTLFTNDPTWNYEKVNQYINKGGKLQLE